MKCKFNYLQGKLRICRYFSKNPFLYLSEKLDIKHLYILNLKKKFFKKISSKICFPLCMECKFAL